MSLPAVTFPAKPLKLSKITQKFSFLLLIGAACILLFLGMAWWLYGVGQGIYSDYRISGHHRVLADAQIDGQCKTRKFGMTDCRVTIRDQGRTWEQTFAFFDFSKQDYQVAAVISADNPDLASVDLALEKLGNRIGFFVFLALVALLALWAAYFLPFVSLPRQRRVVAAFNEADAQPWQMVSVPTWKQGHKYAVELDGVRRSVVLQFNKTRPWVLEEGPEGPVLLGIAPKNGGNPVPLDQKLSAIEGLDKAERQSLIAQINQHFGA